MAKTTFSKMDIADLEKALREKRVELQNFRFGIAGSRTKNVKSGRDLKRDIARVMTELTKRAESEKTA